MLTAYEFLDAVVDDKLDLCGDEGLEALLQLNHLVLLGRGYDLRAFDRHIAVTRRQFFDNFRRYVKPIRRWYRRHETENPCDNHRLKAVALVTGCKPCSGQRPAKSPAPSGLQEVDGLNHLLLEVLVPVD